MTVLPKLTLLEKDMLAGIYASQYNDGSDQPNVWSWSVEPRIVEMKQRKGVASSLNKKGIIVSEGSGDEAAMWVTPLGFEVAKAECLLEQNEEGYWCYNEKQHEILVEVEASDKKIEIVMVTSPKGISTPVAMQMQEKSEDKVSVKLGYGIVEVMQLDDSAMVKSYNIEVDFSKKSFITVTAARKDMLEFCDAVEYRNSTGWDQPLWYMSCAKAAGIRIRHALGREGK